MKASDIDFAMATESAPECDGLVGRWSEDEYRDSLADPKHRHWLFEQGGTLAGFVIGYDLVSAGAGFYLKRIVVSCKARGLGRRAIYLVSDLARRQLGAPYLWLGVYPHNARAIRCYEAAGLRPFDAKPKALARHRMLSDGAALDVCLLYKADLPLTDPCCVRD
ncbi:MAG: GNAT family N-acetyltransferase [Myxococcales bacterium]|nr:GNAT family N-acetyltransferase [Myxococcales bacterium]